MKIAIVQLAPIKGDIEQNINAHVAWINQAVAHKTDMVVFPELSLTGYEPTLAPLLATSHNDQRLDCFQQLSDDHQITIGVGLPTRHNDDLNISMVIFRPAKERITYSKQYLHPTETAIFTPATNPLVIKFDSDIVAPAICYELSNPDHHTFAAQNNATVYMASVLNSVSGVASDLAKLAAIAQRYRMVTFMANFVGQSGGYNCAGKSSVWNTNGEMVKQLGEKEEGLIIFDTKTDEAITVVV
jgi:predicted amidohydrolase